MWPILFQFARLAVTSGIVTQVVAPAVNRLIDEHVKDLRLARIAKQGSAAGVQMAVAAAADQKPSIERIIQAGVDEMLRTPEGAALGIAAVQNAVREGVATRINDDPTAVPFQGVVPTAPVQVAPAA